jgi:hypothetical protein
MAEARERFGDDARLIGFKHFEPTLAFYARSEVPLVDNAEQLQAELASMPTACIVTRAEHLDALAAALGQPPEIVARYRRFLRTKGEIVVAVPPESLRTATRDLNAIR